MPDKLNLYLQSSPSVGIAHSTLSCERRCYGLRTSLSTSFNPCPRPLIGQECWVFEGACVRLRHLVISPVRVDLRPVASGGAGGAIAPQFLAKQLTLTQPGGQIMSTTILQAPLPPDFLTLRRPCISTWTTRIKPLSR